MIYTLSLRVPPRVAAVEADLRLWAARERGIDVRTIRALRIRHRSIDARQRQIVVNLTIDVFVGEDAPPAEFEPVAYRDVSGRPQVVVVGAGPAGLFAALRLIELGYRPLVLERGKNVHARRKDIALISRQGRVDAESNYCFGEGGAGAFSDGKLFTRSKKRGDGNKILRVFCQHGADTRILSDAHPHIGTDRLPAVIEAMRTTIERCGGQVRFGARATDLLLEGSRRVAGVRLADGSEALGPVVLATGHSARDVYRLLRAQGVALEAKGLAVGVRLEHPAVLIDRIQYHSPAGRGRYLPAAEYSMVCRQQERGVYSFCMCPGGFVVPSASGPEQVVVNGMSPSNRGGRWSNAGMVVELHPDDAAEPSLATFMNEAMHDDGFAAAHADAAAADDALRLMYLQEALERQSWLQGGRSQTAPAQRMDDFVRGRLSYDLPATSYTPGLISSPLHFWLPAFVADRLRAGFEQFGRAKRGFLTREATVIGVETRTSSPVRIVRRPDTLCQVSLEGLYPAGEGAGYAGGIVSAGIDGERCAEAVAAELDRRGGRW